MWSLSEPKDVLFPMWPNDFYFEEDFINLFFYTRSEREFYQNNGRMSSCTFP